MILLRNNHFSDSNITLYIRQNGDFYKKLSSTILYVGDKCYDKNTRKIFRIQKYK